MPAQVPVVADPRARRVRKEVYSGRYIDYGDPQPEQVSLADIAHGLAYTCRFGGHTRHFYSVAEHAVLVASLVGRHTTSIAAQLAALHHDDHEAYLGDVPTPLKQVLGAPYADLCVKLDHAICEHIGFIRPFMFEAEAIKRADAQALRMETHEYLPSRGRDPEWDPAWERFGLHASPTDLLYTAGGRWRPGLKPHEAEQAFLNAHDFLMWRLG